MKKSIFVLQNFETSGLQSFNRPEGAFSKSRPITRSRIPVCPGVDRSTGRHRGVAWGNGWKSVPPATAPAFKEGRGMVRVDSLPSRNFGGGDGPQSGSHGDIGATPWLQTGVLTCQPGC